MGTRSAIGVMHGDKAKVVYCHWDGYLDHNGRILLNHYDSVKANYLVALGGLSSLRKHIGDQHDFDGDEGRENDWCDFYGRDRGEEGNEFKVCFSDAEMFDAFQWCEYFYIMKDGVWYVSEGADAEWKLLADAIADLDIANANNEEPTEHLAAPQEIKTLIGPQELAL